ncbi:tyrosine kinase catalytic domain protein [Rhizoctonia solani 123E]|uniref:Tyrosine kinase catalytic domain protein n=1 Tax=Rhizoctonia solani 123E TaxID=1423351 RepID=A0A074RNT0_9AGAM|nr:tyrosine kinase catalytic domain protein [Rhizoctonia solani 123E]
MVLRSGLGHPPMSQITGEFGRWIDVSNRYDGYLAMVSPWTEIDLAHHLSIQRPPWAKQLSLGIQIADGLAYLHYMGLVYRDLKSANISISQNGTPVLAQFSNSFTTNHVTGFRTSTALSDLSVRWMAPEILKNQEDTPAMNVWRLGMLFC